MESCTQQLSVCSLINRKEGSVSRDKRKQYPAFFFFIAAGYKQFNSTWSKLSFLARINVLCLIILSWPLFRTLGLRDQHGLAVLIFQCDIPDICIEKATRKRQIWDGDAANRHGMGPKWGGANWAVGVESGRPTDPSTHVVCNTSWWERGKKSPSISLCW